MDERDGLGGGGGEGEAVGAGWEQDGSNEEGEAASGTGTGASGRGGLTHSVGGTVAGEGTRERNWMMHQTRFLYV